MLAAAAVIRAAGAGRPLPLAVRFPIARASGLSIAVKTLAIAVKTPAIGCLISEWGARSAIARSFARKADPRVASGSSLAAIANGVTVIAEALTAIATNCEG